MTKRVPLSEMERPRRALGAAIKAWLGCPVCGRAQAQGQDLRIVAYRRKTVRLECPRCGLRFSVGVWDFVSTIARKPECVVAGMDMASAALAAAITGLFEEGKGPEVLHPLIEGMGMAAWEAHLRGIGRWEAWEELCEAHNDTTVDTGGSQMSDPAAHTDGAVDNGGEARTFAKSEVPA